MRMIEMLNKRFGRLVVTAECSARHKAGQIQWVCMCDCGNETTVTGYLLRSGNTKSCGCYRVDRGREHGKTINLRHGEGSNGKETPEYNAWAQLRTRCNSKSHKQYADYGGRGITVCDRWGRYENFLADMGRRPSDGHSIDRVDNDGNYEPNNCRWATSVEQNNNTRFNMWRAPTSSPRRPFVKSETLMEAFGLKATLSEWLEDAGVSKQTYKRRIARGMSVEDALRIPVVRGRPLKKRSV